MQSIREQYRTVVHSKNPKEFFQNIPWTLIEILAAVPAAVFILTVVYQLITIFVSPYGYDAATTFAKKICVIFTAVVVILSIGKLRIEKTSFREVFKQNLPFVCFVVLMLLMLISTFINGFTHLALHGDGYRCESLFSFLIYFAGFYLCASVIRNQKIKTVILYTFLIASVIQNGTTLILTYVFHNNILFSEHIIGIYWQFNHYGYYLLLVTVLSSVLTVMEKNKALKAIAFVSFLIGDIALILNTTFGTFLSCAVAMLFSIIVISIVKGKFDLFSLGMFLLFWAIAWILSFWQPTVLSNLTEFARDVSAVASNGSGAESAGTGRMLLWKQTFGYISEKPLFGHGVEGIGHRLLIDSGVYHVDRPHNEYLQYAAFFGIPAMLMYLSGLFTVFLSAWKNRKKIDGYSLAALCTAFAYLFSALFGNTMHYTAPYLFIFLGLSFRLCRAETPNSAENHNLKAD